MRRTVALAVLTLLSLTPPHLLAAEPAPQRWLEATAYAIPKETTNEGEGYFSIVTGHNGRLYIGTSKHGVGSYLVEFDPKTKAMRVVVDAQKATGTTATGFAAQSKIHTRNNVGASGKIYFATKQGYPGKNEKLTDYPGGYPMVYDPETGKTRVYPIPVPHQGIISITPDESRGVAYISTCADTRPDSTHFMILDLKAGTYRDLMDCRHMYAFIVVDYKGRAYHPILGGDIARWDPNGQKLERLKQTIDGKPPTKESLLALPETHPINWDISPDGKTLYALPMSGNHLYAYDLTAAGDTLPGRTVGELLPGAKSTDCRAMCTGPTGDVWAAVTAPEAGVSNLMHLVLYRPGDKAPHDLGAVAIANPNYTEFKDASGKPLPFHAGVAKLANGKSVTQYAILGISQGLDHTVYALALSPYTLLAVPPTALSTAAPADRPLPDVQALGEVSVENDVLTAKAPTATLVIGEADADTYRMTAEWQPAPKAGGNYLMVMPSDPKDVMKPGVLRVSVGRDAPGLQLSTGTNRYDAATKQWVDDKDTLFLQYWPAPTDKAGLGLVQGLSPRTWHDHWLRLRIDVDRHHVTYWFDGRMIQRLERPADARGPVALTLLQGDRLRDVRFEKGVDESLYLPVDLAADVNDRFAAPVGKPHVDLAGVPFDLAGGGPDHLSLAQAQWIEWKTDPADYYEWYDNGPPVVHDPRMPMLRVPAADYVAAHLLAVADDDPNRTATLTLEAGRFGYAGQVVQHDFTAVVPRRGEAAKLPVGEQVSSPAGPLFHVRVPMAEAFAQDIENYFDIELTKEIRLARHEPDPNRFRRRPLGPPSAVRIAAVTLELSPLQMRVGSKEPGHAFVEPQKPTFQVRLRNISGVEQAYQLTLAARPLDGAPTQAVQSGKVPPGQTAEVAVTVPVNRRGYHDLAVALHDGSGRLLLERHTSFAVLPPDTRTHRDTSPFGTWDFSGGHFTPDNPDVVGPLYVKMGLHYGMFGFKPEVRKKYGVVIGSEPVVLTGLKDFEEFRKANPDAPLSGMIFHEHGISGEHLSRVPDLFHDRPPYKMDAEEQKQFQQMWDQATKGPREIKAKYPMVHLRFGNGALPTKEEFYRHKYPAELFDSAGNESASFGRLPEAQPPDCVAQNASIWMDRQLLDAYGYKDKSVTQCYETCYPATNPGNLTEREQADYFVRHSLLALAWGIPELKYGCLSDMGNSYYFSNWGATGFTHSRPEVNVKPSFVTVATLTRVLDGAKFERELPLGSDSLYGMEFARPDGTHAYAFWTIRGRRKLRLYTNGTDPASWVYTDGQGNETKPEAGTGTVLVMATPSPAFLTGKGRLSPVETTDPPEYDERPAGKSAVLTPLANLEDWTVEEGRNAELEYYNMLCPRRKGDFVFEPAAAFEGKEHVLKVTPRPIHHGKDTMPMYAVLAHKRGIPVPGTPTEIGLWVNGNSGWGRAIFELQDASGQRWISLGAQQDVPNKWLEDAVPKEMLTKMPKQGMSDWNTEDVFGVSRFNFDGWRYVAFPLPGNYPGEHFPWPANSQWRWDKDGLVHYPLTFRKLVVELPEKVLHVTKWAPPARAEVYLKDLTVGQLDTAVPPN